MLRTLVLLLLLANAGFWAWRQGWLEPLHSVIGARPEGEREPERWTRQLHPERLQLAGAEASAPLAPSESASAAPVLSPAASAASEPAAPATACLEAGPFDSAASLSAAQTVVQLLLPTEASSVRRLEEQRLWVALGPFVEAGPLRQKREELQGLGLTPESARLTADGAPYLVLERHALREAAEAAQKRLVERGVRSSRIVDASALVPRALRVAAADADQQRLLAALPADKLGGRRFEPCPPETP